MEILLLLQIIISYYILCARSTALNYVRNFSYSYKGVTQMCLLRGGARFRWFENRWPKPLKPLGGFQMASLERSLHLAESLFSLLFISPG